MVMTMIKQILALLVCFAMLASATFFEKTLATTGTEYSLSTLVTDQQYGNNTFLTFDSSSGKDNQSITINYMTPTYDQKSFTRTLEGETATTTGGLNYQYVLKGSTLGGVENSSATGSISYWNIGFAKQLSRRAVHILDVTETGNNADNLIVWLNGTNIGNITAHSGSLTTTYTNVAFAGLGGNNNLTILPATTTNFTETKSNTTAITGGSGTQRITIANTPLALTANVTITGDIPAAAGVESKTNTTVVTLTERIISAETKTNSTATDATGFSMVTLANTPVDAGGSDASYLNVVAANLVGEVLVTINGAYVGALAINGTNTWQRNMTTDAFLLGANNISFSGAGTSDITSVSLESHYISTPASTTGNHKITLANTSTGGNLSITKGGGACEISITFNGVWQGNLTGINTGGVWTLGNNEAKVGVNNLTYTSTGCTATTVQPVVIDSTWANTFTVSLNGVSLGTFSSSPSTWTGKTIVSGVNNISFSSSSSTANLTNSTLKVLYNSAPLITRVNGTGKYFTDRQSVIMDMPDTANNWSFISSGVGCPNYTRVYHLTGNIVYTSDSSATSSSSTVNTDDGTTATLYDAPVKYIYVQNSTYFTDLWYRDGSGNRVIVEPWRLVNCTNPTLTNNISTSDVTTTQYTRSGNKTAAITDIAYVFGVKLSSVAEGTVTVADDDGTVIYSVLKGATRPVDNGGSKMCISATGCTVKNLFYGGDALWKMTARIFAHDGTNRTGVSVFQSAGTGNYGDGTITFGAGERVVFYGKPYTDNTNITFNYEAR